MQQLTSAQLAMTFGGTSDIVTDPTTCTTGNPTGARVYNQSMETDHSGPSMSDRVTSAVDKATAPWELFNGLFGGRAIDAPRPEMPSPSRPGIR